MAKKFIKAPNIKWLLIEKFLSIRGKNAQDWLNIDI